MGKKTFWNLPLKEGKVVSRELGRNALILSGFSITTLVFLMNLYREQFRVDLLGVQLFLASLIAYFVVSEIARNAIYYWEYAIADIGYISASILLFLALAQVILTFQLGVMIFAFAFALITALTIFTISSLRGIWRMRKQDYPSSSC